MPPQNGVIDKAKRRSPGEGSNTDMVVSVNFLGFHRERIQIDRIQIPISNETRVADVLCYIQQKYPDLFLKEEMVLVTVNQHISSLNQMLKANDEVSFIPHIGGG